MTTCLCLHLIITGHELFPAKEHTSQEKLTQNPALQRPSHAGESEKGMLPLITIGSPSPSRLPDPLAFTVPLGHNSLGPRIGLVL